MPLLYVTIATLLVLSHSMVIGCVSFLFRERKNCLGMHIFQPRASVEAKLRRTLQVFSRSVVHTVMFSGDSTSIITSSKIGSTELDEQYGFRNFHARMSS